ncbi:citryl-CoA lyase [Rugamonas rubra]|uniref:Citrate synthase n=1 Tax=Rugamonas rubra TaxID=758825 RepID=A0A1I4SAR3_9BURK|nr:citryl-CoA lyase [Rugamonas rubra]SFM61394.1 citrate synthase [Rugamonas rubra]
MSKPADTSASGAGAGNNAANGGAPTPSPRDLIHTRIWQEEPEPDNPFATRAAYCRGYDVFGELVGQARWVEMLLLLLRDERPAPAAVATLEALAVALANPGPRDASVHAAMCGGVGGSTAAASLIAALSVGAGRNGGARDVHDAMLLWQRCGTDLAAWADYDPAPAGEPMQVWPAAGHLPGFEPHGVSTTTVVRQLLTTLAGYQAGPRCAWLLERLETLRLTIGLPLAISGVAAAALSDLGLTPAEGEMLYLLLRLPGAAAHALEQQAGGFRQFPFYPLELDPAATPEAP